MKLMNKGEFTTICDNWNGVTLLNLCFKIFARSCQFKRLRKPDEKANFARIRF